MGDRGEPAVAGAIPTVNPIHTNKRIGEFSDEEVMLDVNVFDHVMENLPPEERLSVERAGGADKVYEHFHDGFPIEKDGEILGMYTTSNFEMNDRKFTDVSVLGTTAMLKHPKYWTRYMNEIIKQ